MVWMATFPAMFYGMYNVGAQAQLAIMAGGALPDMWQAALFTTLGGSLSADTSVLGMMLYGACFLPSYLCKQHLFVGGFLGSAFLHR